MDALFFISEFLIAPISTFALKSRLTSTLIQFKKSKPGLIKEKNNLSRKGQDSDLLKNMVEDNEATENFKEENFYNA